MELWAHQKKAVEIAKNRLNLALLYDVGTGKTATMIHILRDEYNLRKKICPTLIFSPLTVCAQWKTEFAKFSKIPQEKILVLTQTGAKRAEILAKLSDPGVIVVTNYESVQIAAFYAALLKWSPDILVADESQRLKDSESKRAKKIYPLAHAARRRFILTGTPILNSLMDIYGQYKAMDPDIFNCNFWTFKKKYFYDINAGKSWMKYPDWRPKPEAALLIGEILARTSVQAKKEECLDLPPLMKIEVPVTLSAKQKKAYEDMRKHFVAEVKDSVISAEFAMTKTLRMQQILSGFIPTEQGATWCEDVPRLDVLKELLESIGGKKTIIWTTFKATYAKLELVCKEAGYEVRHLTGEQTTYEKRQAIHDFCQGGANALIANPAAGGAGINLTESQYSIYYAKGYSLEHFLQSEGRNYRGGSDMHERITHYHLVATDTLDEVINDALLRKKNVGDQVLHWAKALDTKPKQVISPVQGVTVT